MRYELYQTLDHLSFSTKSLNFFFCACAECISLNCELLSKFAVSKDLNSISWILYDTFFQ